MAFSFLIFLFTDQVKCEQVEVTVTWDFHLSKCMRGAYFIKQPPTTHAPQIDPGHFPHPHLFTPVCFTTSTTEIVTGNLQQNHHATCHIYSS